MSAVHRGLRSEGEWRRATEIDGGERNRRTVALWGGDRVGERRKPREILWPVRITPEMSGGDGR
ncbi:hypothetical protein E2562_037733 [Oryza meyeriana var. granulata]|uniref:Uncharacterized protein n=1 Tax=Oryza meyeriana var. granulata TaxID=110450 RepID=A0A6G1C1B9_9ORYZ|nr:hypothetical protein E2562_037733 [Oryza meyeriana var. granulata]